MSESETVNEQNALQLANTDRSDEHQYLTFILADEEYAVDILRVQEIKGWESATPIPNMPSYIKGVINLRGTIVPVVDLRDRFNLESVEYSKTTVVIVLKIHSKEHERTMGIVVDAVSDVYNVADDEIKPPPDFEGVINVEAVRGLATVHDKMVIILDIDNLINVGVLARIDKNPDRESDNNS